MTTVNSPVAFRYGNYLLQWGRVRDTNVYGAVLGLVEILACLFAVLSPAICSALCTGEQCGNVTENIDPLVFVIAAPCPAICSALCTGQWLVNAMLTLWTMDE